MKRVSHILLALSAVLIAACSADKVAVDDCSTFTIPVGVAGSTRATADGDGAGNYVCRYIMEVWSGDVMCCRQTMENLEPGTKYVEFTLSLPALRKYDFLFWADAGAEHYDASQLGCVHQLSSSGANKDSNDAFYLAERDLFPSDLCADTLLLRRAVTQLNIITNDMDMVAGVSDLSPVAVHMKYRTEVASSFSVRSGEVSDFGLREWTEEVYSSHVHDSSLTLAMDYFFVDSAHQVVDVSNMDIHMSDSTVIHRVDMNNVTVKRNCRTNAIGNFMSKSSAHFDVVVDDTWLSELQ